MPDAEPASILDASALIAFLHDEAGSDAVLDAITQTAAVSIVNWAETLSKVAADGDDPQKVAAAFEDTLILEPLTETDCLEIARLRPLTKTRGLSLADRAASHSPDASRSPCSPPTATGPTSTSASPFSSSAERARRSFRHPQHQRLRWHLHQLDPTFAVPLRMLARKSHLERVSRWLARQEQELQVQLARELIVSCRSLDRTIAALDQELERRTAELAPALLELPGCGPITAAKLLAEIGPVGRFRSDAQLARHSGVAPLEASSGRIQRHRLDRHGNRQLNAALYRIAITQARIHPGARAYLERKRAEGKSRREAIRCLKRLLVRTVFNTLKASPALT